MNVEFIPFDPSKRTTMHDIGPCRIKFNDFDIGPTLKDQEVLLTVVANTSDITTEEDPNIKEVLVIGTKITFKFSTPFSGLIKDTFPFGAVIKGKLVLESLYGNIKIILPNAAVTPSYNFIFKNDKNTSVSFSVKALKDANGDDIIIEYKDWAYEMIGGVSV